MISSGGVFGAWGELPIVVVAIVATSIVVEGGSPPAGGAAKSMPRPVEDAASNLNF